MSKESAVVYTEKSNQLYALHYLKAKGYYFGRVSNVPTYDPRAKCYRKNPYLFVGMPDLMGFIVYQRDGDRIMDSQMFAIEVKSSNEKISKLSPEQEKFKQYFERVGGMFITMRCPEDLEKLL